MTSRNDGRRPWPDHPTVLEIPARVWIEDLSRRAGEPRTLADLPEEELERFARLGFDGVWLMGVWERSPAGRRIALEHEGLLCEYRRALPDFTEDDVAGSPYAVHRYAVDPALGGDEALAALRERLWKRGLRLLLDFVPNHVAVDHAWVRDHPERLVQGPPSPPPGEAADFFEAGPAGAERVFAHGRDPNFPGWTDTVQIDYRRPETRRAMTDLLLALAERCDGLRCDMAMLANRDVFLRTWGGAFEPPLAEFWPAAVTDLKTKFPGFLLVGEVYWDLEWDLQQMGFDHVYDKRLYDRLVDGCAGPVRDHLRADAAYQRGLVRFVENHDEPRAAAVFGPRTRSAAALTLTLPGLRLVHDGQVEGRRVKIPVQLIRRPEEDGDAALAAFHEKLLASLRSPVFRRGRWRLLDSHFGEGDSGALVAHAWFHGEEARLVAANLSPGRVRAVLPLHWPALAGRTWWVEDLLEGGRIGRGGDELLDRGWTADIEGFGARLVRLFPKA